MAGEASLDLAWTAVWPAAARLDAPVIAGGRSAGAQVACRTASELGARAVLALAYPMLGPGSPAELLATGRPTLVVQGGSDPFGRPASSRRSRPGSRWPRSRRPAIRSGRGPACPRPAP